MIKKIMKKSLILLTVFLFINSCATPTVVNIIGPNDNEFSCKKLSSEITKANQYADEAQAAKKMNNPHNIGAIIFFLPGMGVTMKNVDEATEAAKARSLHLNKLKEKKNC
jgi:hypothetical protein